MTNQERRDMREALDRACGILYGVVNIDRDGIGELVLQHINALEQILNDRALDRKEDEDEDEQA